MVTPNEKLAASLEKLSALQADGHQVFPSKALSRVHRERLIRNGFLKEIIKGWLIPGDPEDTPGSTTFWSASFWAFCGSYCENRFETKWHLSPIQSLLIHAESSSIPSQVIVYSPEGGNYNLSLPFKTSLYDLKQKTMPPNEHLVRRNGLRIFSIEAALTRVPPTFFQKYPIEAQVILSGIHDPSEILRYLLDGGHSLIAGRLAGAFRRAGKASIADEIISTMKAAGYDIRPTDPFVQEQVFIEIKKSTLPIVARLQTMWAASRATVLQLFPKPPGKPVDRKAYLKAIDEIYRQDAYHSLSIEGYRVTPALIQRVLSGKWDPTQNEADRKNRDALAARGYWQAFNLVKQTVSTIIKPKGSADIRTTHRAWYRELFQPYVAAGLATPSTLAGYRNQMVFLRNSRHVPPRWEIISEAMQAFFDLIEQEPEPAVRAVLGHWLFGYIHPYPDGNGRIARFLMNALLASGGYPWTIIRVEDRETYLAGLEEASIHTDLGPFTSFIAKQINP